MRWPVGVVTTSGESTKHSKTSTATPGLVGMVRLSDIPWQRIEEGCRGHQRANPGYQQQAKSRLLAGAGQERIDVRQAS
jgi:hypothetical protein